MRYVASTRKSTSLGQLRVRASVEREMEKERGHLCATCFTKRAWKRSH